MKNSLVAFLFLCSTITPPVFGQLVSVGVKGGGSLLEPAPNNDESRRYIVGPSIEVRLPAGFALEADALYQRVGSNFALNTSILAGTNLSNNSQITAGFTVSNRVRGNAWEFPLLGKYYFRREARLQPFAASGFAFRTIGIQAKGTNVFLDSNNNARTGDFKVSYRSDLAVGAVFAGGLRYKLGPVSLVPEIRYTRWGGTDFIVRKNEAAVFMGFTF